MEGAATETSIHPRFDLSHLRESGREVQVQGGAEGRHSLQGRREEGGAWPASLTQLPHLYPLHNPGLQIS